MLLGAGSGSSDEVAAYSGVAHRLLVGLDVVVDVLVSDLKVKAVVVVTTDNKAMVRLTLQGNDVIIDISSYNFTTYDVNSIPG
jgi:hypothetical protein